MIELMEVYKKKQESECVGDVLRRIDAKVEIVEVRRVDREGRGAEQMALVE